MNTPHPWLLLVHVLVLAIPLLYALAALASHVGTRRKPTVHASALAFGLAILGTAGAKMAHDASFGAPPLLGVRMDVVTCVMLLLVCGIGLVIARYSRTALDGEPGRDRYFSSLCLTLSAVTTIVVANNLAVVALAWTATSLTLHRLLTFYPHRTAARVAAHKKFIVSRLAEVCFWTCLGVVYANVGSLDIDRIAAWAGRHPNLTPSMHFAAILVVVAVALKSAQLPFHGWLIQVMEAPTPVSALLHAGVVNIGGFLMIRLAPWLAHAWPAQLLLVGIGLMTAVLAASVMTTRVSVKVALAWSTCAQMGFLLVQCGLGAWHLALLHLVAHSLYKAHAFLSAGNAVEQWRLREIAAPPPPPAWRRLGVAVAVSFAGIALGMALLGPPTTTSGAVELAPLVLAMLVALSLAPLLAQAGPQPLAVRIGRATGVAVLYAIWHASAATLLPQTAPSTLAVTIGWLFVALAFPLLFLAHATLRLHPTGRLARTVYPWLFAGLYLDERFTRLTFGLWPPRLDTGEATRAGATEVRS